jgi:single-strand DNA-binding protein
MLNQIVLVGRLVQDPEIKSLESGKRVSDLILAVPRSWKNVDGIYETDFIPVKLWSGVAENTAEYCHKGDMVGIKGRLQMIIIGETNKQKLEVVAEKVTFLSSGKSKDKSIK